MALKIKIAKGDYEALDDSLKTQYVADGENYKLDADYEDVTGLKNKANELLAEQKRLKEQMKAFEGLDADAARAAIEAAQKAQDEKLVAAGDIEAIRAQAEERIAKEVAKVQAELEKERGENKAILDRLHFEALSSVLVGNGADPLSVELLAVHLQPQTEFLRTETGFEIKKKGGIGDASEFQSMIDELKESRKTDRFFQPTVSPGSGASGSDGNGNGSNLRRSAMSVREKAAFVSEHGQEAYEALPMK